MPRRSLALAPAALATLALALAAPAVAQPAMSVTATGTAQVKVKPANRHSNASIARAVKSAEKAAVPLALDAARAQALIYAQDAGLTLGTLLSVSDASSGAPFGVPSGPFFGPFGPGRYCGTVRQAVIRKVNGKPRVVRTKRVHRCFVPPYASATLTVTYSAT